MSLPPPLARIVGGFGLLLAGLGVLVTAAALVLGVVWSFLAWQSSGRPVDAIGDATRALLLVGVAGAWLFAPSLLAFALARERPPRPLLATSLAVCALTVALAATFGLSAAVDKPAMLPSVLVLGGAAAVGLAAGVWLVRNARPVASSSA